MVVTEKISFKHQMAQSSLDGYLQTYLLVNPTWEGVQIPWIGGGGAKSAPP